MDFIARKLDRTGRSKQPHPKTNIGLALVPATTSKQRKSQRAHVVCPPTTAVMDHGPQFFHIFGLGKNIVVQSARFVAAFRRLLNKEDDH
jgi:hypothetical protein